MLQQRWEAKIRRKESSPQLGIEFTTTRSWVWHAHHWATRAGHWLRICANGVVKNQISITYIIMSHPFWKRRANICAKKYRLRSACAVAQADLSRYFFGSFRFFCMSKHYSLPWFTWLSKLKVESVQQICLWHFGASRDSVCQSIILSHDSHSCQNWK